MLRFLFRKRSLQHHLVLLAAGAILPLAVFSIAIVYQLGLAHRDASEQRFTQAATDLASAIDAELNGSIRALTGMAEAGSIRRGDLQTFRTHAERMVQSHPLWDAILVLTPDGQQVLNTSIPAGEPLPAVNETESFQRIVETGEPIVGSLQIGSRSKQLGFPVRVPVSNEQGNLQYILTAVISPKSLEEALRQSYSRRDEWTRTIVDTRGTVVVRTRAGDKFVGTRASPSFQRQTRGDTRGFYKDVTLDGQEAYVAFSRAAQSDWTAAVVVPRHAVDGAARQWLSITVSLGVASTALGIAAGLIIARRLARSLGAATAAAEDLALGRTPSVRPSRILEVDRLGTSLQRSSALLQAHAAQRDAHLQTAEAARAEAEAVNRGKDNFLAMLGHELRNPLGPLQNALYLLDRPDLPHDEAKRLLDTATRQVNHMGHIVNDLLDASRLARGKFQLHTRHLDLALLLRQVGNDFTRQFAHAGIALRVHTPHVPVTVLGDATRLEQSLGNLLHNALKFTPRGGQVDLRLTAENDHATIHIRDTGPGIPPDVAPRLFEPFAQGPQEIGRPHGGLGLGLSLVKGFVTLHGGTVQAHSNPDTPGTAFTIRLPLAQPNATPESPAQPPTATASPAARPRRVLIVEDLPDAANTLAMLLRLDHHIVSIAHTGQDAQRLAAAERPEVIICDIGLPDIDGYTLCQRLRATPGAEHSVFIALTGYGQPADVAKARLAGFDHHFTKPVDIPALRRTVQQDLTTDPPDPIPA